MKPTKKEAATPSITKDGTQMIMSARCWCHEHSPTQPRKILDLQDYVPEWTQVGGVSHKQPECVIDLVLDCTAEIRYNVSSLPKPCGKFRITAQSPANRGILDRAQCCCQIDTNGTSGAFTKGHKRSALQMQGLRNHYVPDVARPSSLEWQREWQDLRRRLKYPNNASI